MRLTASQIHLKAVGKVKFEHKNWISKVFQSIFNIFFSSLSSEDVMDCFGVKQRKKGVELNLKEILAHFSLHFFPQKTHHKYFEQNIKQD